MRNLKNKLTTSGKGLKNIQSKRIKGFGYQVLGFGSGTATKVIIPYSVEWLCLAGGASGGNGAAGGGGAGGYRLKYASENSGGGTNTESTRTLSGYTVYTITVGAGGATQASVDQRGNVGVDSSITGSDIVNITSAGGGGGGACGNVDRNDAGGSGGSGGGAGEFGGAASGGSGTANQGYDGGDSNASYQYDGAGGGGAGAVGQDTYNNLIGGDGGDGLSSNITGSSVARGGGGGGGGDDSTSDGGSGGGGDGGYNYGAGGAADANTGGGGGGARQSTTQGGAGGSGVVILRMADGDYSGTTTGSPTVDTNVGGSGDTVVIFNASGSYTG